MPLILVVLLSQLLFTTSDLLGRYHMRQSGFHLASFISLWFIGYLIIRSIATLGQLYIFSNLEVGKTMALFSACSLILVNLAGLFFLGEVLPLQAYLGIMLAITAIVILSLSK